MMDYRIETAAECSQSSGVEPVHGVMEGCSVLTLDGYVSIDALEIGARVVTRRGLRYLRAVESSIHYFHAIRIKKGTLGFYRPHRDLCMAPDQELFVRDWRAQLLYGQPSVILPVGRLTDGTYICEDRAAKMHRVFDLRFDEEEVFYVDGVEVMAKQVATQPDMSPIFA
jgi:hypothetical protein